MHTSSTSTRETSHCQAISQQYYVQCWQAYNEGWDEDEIHYCTTAALACIVSYYCCVAVCAVYVNWYTAYITGGIQYTVLVPKPRFSLAGKPGTRPNLKSVDLGSPAWRCHSWRCYDTLII